MKCCGIEGAVLDQISITLQPATIWDLAMCPAARTFWAKVLHEEPLKVDVPTVHLFSHQPDFSCYAIDGCIDVRGLPNAWSCFRSNFRSSDLRNIYLPLSGQDTDTAIITVRKLKVCLLARFAPDVFEKLGGDWR